MRMESETVSLAREQERLESRIELAEELAREQLIDYQHKMSQFLQEFQHRTGSCPSALELRQHHALVSMSAIDAYRKNSSGRPILVWKLERELASLFNEILMLTSRSRRESFDEFRSTSPSPRRATVGPSCWLVVSRGNHVLQTRWWDVRIEMREDWEDDAPDTIGHMCILRVPPHLSISVCTATNVLYQTHIYTNTHIIERQDNLSYYLFSSSLLLFPSKQVTVNYPSQSVRAFLFLTGVSCLYYSTPSLFFLTMMTMLQIRTYFIRSFLVPLTLFPGREGPVSFPLYNSRYICMYM